MFMRLGRVRKRHLKIGWCYLTVVTIIAVAVGLFEVWGIAHYRVGWGEPLPQDKVWGKPLITKAPFGMVGSQLLTRYHFVMFCVLVPALVLILGVLLRHSTASPPAQVLGWLAFVIAGTLGVMVSEDLLFFVFSTILGTPYPHALSRLLRGEANWHPFQISFFGLFKLPAAYIGLPPIAAFLLWVASRSGL
jgi:hypothetical protein